MAVCKVFFRKSVGNDLSGIPKRDVKRILDRIKAFEENPRPPNSENLLGGKGIAYPIHDNELTVRAVRADHRKNIYR